MSHSVDENASRPPTEFVLFDGETVSSSATAAPFGLLVGDRRYFAVQIPVSDADLYETYRCCTEADPCLLGNRARHIQVTNAAGRSYFPQDLIDGSGRQKH